MVGEFTSGCCFQTHLFYAVSSPHSDHDDYDDDGGGGGVGDDPHKAQVGEPDCGQSQRKSKLEQIVPNHVMHSLERNVVLQGEKVKPHTTQIAQCICSNCKMYLSKLPNVFL